jgi:pyruvate, water dikinase
MNDPAKPIDSFLNELKERAKELNCLYKVQELLNQPNLTTEDLCKGVIAVIPEGWQYPETCQVEMSCQDLSFHTDGFKKTPWEMSSDILVQNERFGVLRVVYTEEMPPEDEGPFLKEERKLIDSIADQVSMYLLHQQLRQVFQKEKKKKQDGADEWTVIIDLLKRTDPTLLIRITRKMINYLGWQGIKEGDELLDRFAPASFKDVDADMNQPFEQRASGSLLAMSNEVFKVASKHLTREVILDNIQKWIKEERSSFLIDALLDPNSSLAEMSSALERYRVLAKQGIELSESREQWFRVTLIRRILSDQINFINIAKQHISIADFSSFMERVIFPASSHGKLGGKGSSLFLASQILKMSAEKDQLLKDIKTPKTWYITSDSVLYFMSYNNMEDIVEQKYKDISQVRQEYPYIVHMFKSAPMPPEIIKGLTMALEDFGNVPLIVRSSSLLEDQTDAVFAGKYKSLFIANIGSKEERLTALIDAIAEVFASLFGPDPIEYRFQHGLMDFHEEMGIMIQEVVGTKIGHYFMPAFAGVAFSNNEFRWSSRIKREDGLVRLVPGLGTRAVDRIGDDYPLLVAPGQPGLRVNVTNDEIVYYAPKKADVINLESRKFETIAIAELLKVHGREYPMVNQLVSVLEPDFVRLPSTIKLDFDKGSFIVTFEGLFSRTPFLKQVQHILGVLQKSFNRPIDIEFAHDGTNFYLLQCRSQSSFTEGSVSAVIPRDIPEEDILFSAHRYISNGKVPDIKYIVYVDPQKYAELTNYQDMVAIGRAVGRLNQILPKRQFILMGPGRWGSRGDIKLGVNVTYSDINNTAMLVEIARKKKDYLPELSFGTHFFQDLVEASIRYLPLYPDEKTNVFQDEFLLSRENMLKGMLPDFAAYADVIHVIDVKASTGNRILRVLMNADTEEALAFLASPETTAEYASELNPADKTFQPEADYHWRWRLQAAENIAAQLDPARFGVRNFYIFGSTKNATAGPGSDIDVLIHFQGTAVQRKDLLNWLEGWSLSLSQVNFLRTGVQSKGMLDVHLVSDADIKNDTSWAVKIGAVTDAARPLAMGMAVKPEKPT